jgi:hypothetical protein
MREEPRELVHEPGDLASAAAHASVGTAENGNRLGLPGVASYHSKRLSFRSARNAA